MTSLDNVLASFVAQNDDEIHRIEDISMLKQSAKIAGVYYPDDLDLGNILLNSNVHQIYSHMLRHYEDVSGANVIIFKNFACNEAHLGVYLNLRGCNVNAIYNTSGRHYTTLEDERRDAVKLGYPHVECNFSFENDRDALLRKLDLKNANTIILSDLGVYELRSLCSDNYRNTTDWDVYSDFVRDIARKVHSNTLFILYGPGRFGYEKQLNAFRETYFRDMSASEFNRFIERERQSLFKNATCLTPNVDLSNGNRGRYIVFAQDIKK